MIQKPKSHSAMIVVLSLCLLACHYSIFLQFFPNRYGRLGHDYAIFLPAMVDGLFWFKVNGLWAVPWFTPSFSGGGLGYLHLERAYYTIPQLLAFVFEPLTVLRITFGVFAVAGYGGCYLLLRRAFQTGRWAAALGACLFLFNGFYAHRMIVGHFGASPFMLLPFVGLGLLDPLPTEKRAQRVRYISYSLLVGMAFAYMVQTWFALLMIPGILSIVCVGMLRGLLYGGQREFWCRLISAAMAGVSLCASKLVATGYILGNFSRSGYRLPGAHSFTEAIGLLLRVLFFSPAFDKNRMGAMCNIQWALERHEWEFDLTPVPLVIIFAGLVAWVLGRKKSRPGFCVSWQMIGQIAGILIIAILPAALNTYDPSWNRFLKEVPLIKNSSTLTRWFFIPIPLVIVLTALTVDRVRWWRKYRIAIAMTAIAVVASLNTLTVRDFYHRQFYDPRPMTIAFRKITAGTATPLIRNISACKDDQGRYVICPAAPNDGLVYGRSPMLSYDAFFGYRQEAYVVGDLHPGPVTDVHNGFLNLKNPACYVWPEANGCKPGDHFREAQLAQAMDFARYKGFSFKLPALQKAANLINIVSLLAYLLWFAFWLLAAPWLRWYHNRKVALGS